MAKKIMKTLFINHKNPSQPQQQTSLPSSLIHSCMELQPNILSCHHHHHHHPSSDHHQEVDDIENVVIRGVKTIKSSKRLFFSPEKTNSILKNVTNNVDFDTPMISTTTMVSLDPYMDFRSSMEEMVEVHRLQDWDMLEELLGCYLMLNEKRNHCYIIRAFVDLVILIKSSSSSSSSTSTSSSSASAAAAAHFVLHQVLMINNNVNNRSDDDHDLDSDSFVTSFSSPMHLSSSSTTAETSYSSSSIAPAEGGVGIVNDDNNVT